MLGRGVAGGLDKFGRGNSILWFPIIPGDERERAMAYVITDDCVSCGTCEPECPVSAISEGDDNYLIDAEKCTGCGTCMEVCPADAIVEKD